MADVPTHQRSFPKRCWYRFTQWVFGLISRVYFRLRTEGLQNAPMEGPAVFICNHASHLDPLMVGVFCPRIICFFARETLFRGLFGVMIRTYDAIPVDQEGSALSGLRVTLGRLKKGDAVLVFPEGSRSYDGELQEMRPGVTTLLRRGKASLTPIGLDGAYEAMKIGTAFPRPRKIAMVIGQTVPHEELAKMNDDEVMELVERLIVDNRDRAKELTRRKRP